MGEVIELGEVAKMLGVEHETARRWAMDGRLPVFRYNDRGRWRAFRHDIEKFLEAHQPKAPVEQTTGGVDQPPPEVTA